MLPRGRAAGKGIPEETGETSSNRDVEIAILLAVAASGRPGASYLRILAL